MQIWFRTQTKRHGFGAARLFLHVDPDIVCVFLAAAGYAVRGIRHRLAVSGDLNVAVNGDRSIPPRVLLDGMLIDALEREFSRIRSFGPVEASVEVVVVNLDTGRFFAHDSQHAPEAARFGGVHDRLAQWRSPPGDRGCREAKFPNPEEGFVLSIENSGPSQYNQERLASSAVCVTSPPPVILKSVYGKALWEGFSLFRERSRSSLPAALRLPKTREAS